MKPKVLDVTSYGGSSTILGSCEEGPHSKIVFSKHFKDNIHSELPWFTRNNQKSRRHLNTSFGLDQFLQVSKLRNSFSKALLGATALRAVGPNISDVWMVCTQYSIRLSRMLWQLMDVWMPFWWWYRASKLVFPEPYKEPVFRGFHASCGRGGTLFPFSPPPLPPPVCNIDRL